MRLVPPARAASLVCLLACAWAVLVLATPWLAAAGGPPGVRVAAATFIAGSLICHQRAERSFHVGGVQLPLCARCTGLFVSGAAGLLLAHLVPRRRGDVAPWRGAPRFAWRHLVALALVPMVVSVAGEAIGIWHGSNVWRALSAVPAGCAVGVLLVESLSFQGRL